MSKKTAPSEKHLETYLWNNPGTLGRAFNPLDGQIHNRYDFLFRQFEIPSGIVDLISQFNGWELTVFELKRETLNTKAFAQLLRYMCDVKQVTTQVFSSLAKNSPQWAAWLRQHETQDGYDLRNIVRGALLGYEVEDENLLFACAASNIDVFTYRYVDPSYTFEQIRTPEFPHMNKNRQFAVKALSNGILGSAIESIFKGAVFPQASWSAIDAAQEYLNQMHGKNHE